VGDVPSFSPDRVGDIGRGDRGRSRAFPITALDSERIPDRRGAAAGELLGARVERGGHFPRREDGVRVAREQIEPVHAVAASAKR
jgi:hypothetical protein